MMEFAGGAIAIGFFTNLLYDIVKTVPNINKENINRYIDEQKIDFNDQQVEQIVEVIEVKHLKDKAEELSKQDFVQTLENDSDIKQIVKNINQTYIENQTNIDNQTNVQNQTNIETQNTTNDNSGAIDNKGGIIGTTGNIDNSGSGTLNLNFSTPKEETPKK